MEMTNRQVIVHFMGFLTLQVVRLPVSCFGVTIEATTAAASSVSISTSSAPLYNESHYTTVSTARSVLHYDDICTTDLDCALSIPGSACRARRCRCQPSFVYQKTTGGGDTCTWLRLGDPSYENWHCYHVERGVCWKGACRCGVGYNGSVGTTECRQRPVNELPCSAKKDCLAYTENTVCAGALCACAKQYKMAAEDRKCVSSAPKMTKFCESWPINIVLLIGPLLLAKQA